MRLVYYVIAIVEYICSKHKVVMSRVANWPLTLCSPAFACSLTSSRFLQ